MYRAPNRYTEMLVLLRVVDDRSFSAAARNLDLTPSAVSKVVARIESRLGVLLFRRGHREIALTSEGEAYCRAARAAVDAVDAADATVFNGTVAQETLRVRSMPIFAQKALAPKLPQFCALHPNLQLEIHLRIDPGNLLDDGMDVAIHVGHLEDSRQFATRFSRTRWIICAAPEYLAVRGTPTHPDELADHVCLNFIPSIGASKWVVRGRNGRSNPLKIESRILANQASVLVELARAGLGITRLVEFQIADDLANGRLVELFPRHQSREEDPIFAVYHSRKHVSNRVRVFLDFLRASFVDPPSWTNWRK